MVEIKRMKIKNKNIFYLVAFLMAFSLFNIPLVYAGGTIGAPAVYMIGGDTTMTNLNYNATQRILTVDVLGPTGQHGSLFLIFNISYAPILIAFDNITFTQLKNITTAIVNLTVIYLSAFEYEPNYTVPALNVCLAYHFSTHHVEVAWDLISNTQNNNTSTNTTTTQEQSNIPLAGLVGFVAVFGIIIAVVVYVLLKKEVT